MKKSLIASSLLAAIGTAIGAASWAPFYSHNMREHPPLPRYAGSRTRGRQAGKNNPAGTKLARKATQGKLGIR